MISSSIRPTRRAEILEALAGCWLGEPHETRLRGGRTEALRKLKAYDPADYGRTRNFLDAPVSQLSPYLRHGMLSTVEVRDHFLAHFPSDQLQEFLRQLAWRDFFEKVLAWYGRGLEEDLEPPKHSVPRSRRIPLDVLQAETGLPCIDDMLRSLFEDGYLHNHERLWIAAYLCHFRGVHWSEGAKLFRQYLYDGDVASNSSSWQWVEGTFASKPYFMNQENIAKFSHHRWCVACPVPCPFDAEYPTLEHRLFHNSQAPLATQESTVVEPTDPPAATRTHDDTPLSQSRELIWVHDAALSWDDPALLARPDAPLVFVFDRPALAREPWAYHRLAFVLDGLDDLFQHEAHRPYFILYGEPVAELSRLAVKLGTNTIHLSEHPNPWVVETAEAMRKTIEVQVHARPVFAEYHDEPRRFSRYWNAVGSQVLGGQVRRESKRWHK